jgi:translation elongation factor EF-1alpha
VEANTSSKQSLHLVVLGHVDAGKSTLMGRLLHELGYVDERAVRKNQLAAQAAGKASFGWAWVMDERDEERQRGVTVDISMRRIQTKRCALLHHQGVWDERSGGLRSSSFTTVIWCVTLMRWH